jgi:hypothetical protein
MEQQPTTADVRLSIRKFRDYSSDLQYADVNTFEDRIGVFLNFCRTDPVFARIREQLVSNPRANFEAWEKQSMETSFTGWVGSVRLVFPTNEDDRVSLLYQFVEAAGDPKFNLLGKLIHWFTVGSNRYDDYLRAFSDAVMRPLFRDLGYKLEEVEARLPDDKRAPVPLSLLQIIHVERAEVNIERNQSFAFHESKNVQIGDSNTQDNRE